MTNEHHTEHHLSQTVNHHTHAHVDAAIHEVAQTATESVVDTRKRGRSEKATTAKAERDAAIAERKRLRKEKREADAAQKEEHKRILKERREAKAKEKEEKAILRASKRLEREEEAKAVAARKAEREERRNAEAKEKADLREARKLAAEAATVNGIRKPAEGTKLDTLWKLITWLQHEHKSFPTLAQFLKEAEEYPEDEAGGPLTRKTAYYNYRIHHGVKGRLPKKAAEASKE